MCKILCTLEELFKYADIKLFWSNCPSYYPSGKNEVSWILSKGAVVQKVKKGYGKVKKRSVISKVRD